MGSSLTEESSYITELISTSVGLKLASCSLARQIWAQNIHGGGGQQSPPPLWLCMSSTFNCQTKLQQSALSLVTMSLLELQSQLKEELYTEFKEELYTEWNGQLWSFWPHPKIIIKNKYFNFPLTNKKVTYFSKFLSIKLLPAWNIFALGSKN